MQAQCIAILGATSHIAKNLVRLWLADPEADLHLFARNPVVVDGFVTQLGYSGIRPALTFADFGTAEYSAIINCVGFGNPSSLREAGPSLFTVTEHHDSIILAYLENNPDCAYINMSSGAVYRGAFAAPVGISTKSVFDVNALGPADFYALAKLHSEARHRAAPDLNIIDLRVFSFFSRHIDPGAGFLLSDIIACLQEKKPLLTGVQEIVRDYVHPEDLFDLVRRCSGQRGVNCALDVYSSAPVTKSEILNYFATEWGLAVEYRDGAGGVAASGCKDIYCSSNTVARDVCGYQPRYGSLDAIAGETAALMEMADRT